MTGIIKKNYNAEKYMSQTQYLVDQIKKGNNTNNFLVVNNEAAFGKTIYTEEALIEAAELGRRSILCREQVKDCIESANRINDKCGKVIAVAVDAKNIKKYKKFLSEYSILIITHARYVKLSHSNKEQTLYSKGREILVIDEEIKMMKPITYSLHGIGELRQILMPYKQTTDLFDEVVSEILTALRKKTRYTFFKPEHDKSNEVTKLRALIDANVSTSHLVECKMTRRQLKEQIDDIETILNSVSIIENTVLYNYKHNIRFWRLKNNIILDASADLNYLYRISPELKLSEQELVFDHSDWWVKIIKENSCRSRKKKMTDFYERVKKYIEDNLNEGDKLLIIGSKDEKDKFVEQGNVKFAWFQSLTGKNDWKDFNKCFIVLNPQVPFPIYILRYMFYGGYSPNSGDKWSACTKNDGVYRFSDPELEELRQGAIAVELYQAIKRINRNNDQHTEVFLINNDSQILDKVLKKLPGAKVSELDMEFQYKQDMNPEDFYRERLENSYAQKFINVCRKLPKGTYGKDEIRQMIDFKDKRSFSRKVLNKEIVDKYIKDNNIQVKFNSIVIN